uniref:hypothetical protein n=1 Tax=Sphingomonas bacterium TaxID=1895847 RepID=UPI00263A327F|nr:hypothetical protein [Sphingomonas bacterium]
MAKLILWITAIALCGCSPSNDATRSPLSTAEVGIAPLPADNATGFLDGNLLQVPVRGDFLWNGMPTSADVLKDYIQQFAHLPENAGRISVEFEPGNAQRRVVWVRRQIAESGLCRQHRCVEAAWKVRRPVVN